MKKKAFTLIELLVVIAIIGILAVVATISLNNARQKARDAKRVADIKQISSALDLFEVDVGRYPTANEFNSGALTYNGTVYMSVVPAAANPPDGSCDATANTFSYTQNNNGASYTIKFCIGAQVGSLAAGGLCATPGGVISCAPSIAIFNCGTAITYGGKTYPTVDINGQCWFAKNLDIGTRVDNYNSAPCLDYSGSSWWSCQTNDSAIEKYCYNNFNINPNPLDSNYGGCDTDGGLYEWPEAMGLPYHCNGTDYSCDGVTCSSPIYLDCSYPDPAITPRQGICPTNWHIPSYYDLISLAQMFTPGCDLDCSSFCNCNQGGFELKATNSNSPTVWDGTDDWGFAAIPSGQRDYLQGGYLDHPSYASFWLSSYPQQPWGYNGYFYLASGDPSIYANINISSFGYSIRCVHD